ncbi:Gfo/Idh/MocA family oxidoreductase [Hymenobacter armeniacus]|uniref:Gfo/Idh/MocA family oxidoreductase n=1 Tax=Hymenobacter armeniacus TaxID=2771358 RepID=A0ABR8JVM7_9BACT|nr:Gfo/Idh/MocA family oxidoreductase [Hymenobacter armeniacus]MBD2721794.1 Gfo/Idh/MocA family oxidoreductase [Hymenobacter armeniacus]
MSEVLPIAVGLIGYGNAGRIYHAPFLTALPQFRLRKVSTRRAAPLPGDAVRVDSAEEVLADEAIELVIIAAPNHRHADLARAALRAGKHVVVDKPFTLNAAEADELITLAQEQQRLLTVYHNRRLTSDFRTVRQVMSSGLLGRVVEYEAHFDRYRPGILAGSWKEEDVPGSGILYDMGAHLIDQAVQLFGYPQAVAADLRVQRRHGAAIDSFDLSLRYPDLKVTLKGSMLAGDAFPQFTVLGEQGSFIKRGRDIQEDALRSGASPTETPGWGREPEAYWGSLTTAHAGLDLTAVVKSEPGDYGLFYRNLYAAVREGAELLVKPREARNVIRILELAQQSSREQRPVPFAE